MPGNSIGRMFVVTSFGESHGPCVGSLIDGCPAGLEMKVEEVQEFLDRRQKNVLGTPRKEPDKVEILSGIFEGFTTGSPICLLIWNRDVDSSAYEELRYIPRPGHADYAAHARYGGFNDHRGGGRFSGRITAGFVAAGGIAKMLLKRIGVEINAHTLSIGSVSVKDALPIEKIRLAYESPVRCADLEVSEKMVEEVKRAEAEGDSLGGVVEAIATGLPPGIGDPVFESIDSELAKALVSIPAVKAVGFGEGFGASALKGSENNDQYFYEDGKVSARTNRAGGVLGGLSSGMPLVMRVAFKPTPSIKLEQSSIDIRSGKEVKLRLRGRFDACVVPRAVPVVEAMCSIVLADQCIRCGLISQVLR